MAKIGYITLQNFRFGLDTRRSELTSVPGTLLRIVDGHINQGGEIEKRKAFVRYFDATKFDPTMVFGLQPTSNGLVVFGSVTAATVGLTAWPAFSSPVTNCPPVSYMQCVHPQGSPAMTSVASSDVFSDIPFVAAVFDNGDTLPFYNGAVVYDFLDGIAKSTSISTIVTALAAMVNRNTTTTGYTATASSNLLIVNAQPSVSVAATLELLPTSTLAVSSTVVAIGANGTLGQSAIGLFQIFGVMTPGTDAISQVLVGGTNILAGTVTSVAVTPDTQATRAAKMAALVAEGINANAGASGYTASVAGGVVYITAVSQTNQTQSLKIVQSGGVVIDDFAVGFSWSATNVITTTTATSTTGNLTSLTIGGTNMLTSNIAIPSGTHDLATFVTNVVANLNANATFTAHYAAYVGGQVSNGIYIRKLDPSSDDTVPIVVVTHFVMSVGTQPFAYNFGTNSSTSATVLPVTQVANGPVNIGTITGGYVNGDVVYYGVYSVQPPLGQGIPSSYAWTIVDNGGASVQDFIGTGPKVTLAVNATAANKGKTIKLLCAVTIGATTYSSSFAYLTIP